MCILFTALQGAKLPDLDWFEAVVAANRDGFGFAWVKGPLVHYMKGLSTMDHLDAVYAAMQARIADSPIL